MLAGDNAGTATYAFFLVNNNFLFSSNCFYWTRFNTAIASPTTRTTRAFSVFPAAFGVIYLSNHSL